MSPLWRAQISLFPCLMMPQVGSCFQGAGVWSVLFIMLCCVVGCCVVEGKSCGGEDYRKRSKPQECAKKRGVYRVRKGNKSANAGRIEQSGHGLNMARNAEGIKGYSQA